MKEHDPSFRQTKPGGFIRKTPGQMISGLTDISNIAGRKAFDNT